MKKIFVVVALAMLVSRADAKPVAESLSSWEGQFQLSPESTTLNIKGLQPITMWKYELPHGSRGTVVGFSNQGGDMLLQEIPNKLGVQTIYVNHVVLQDKDRIAHLIVVYDIQGNGGQKMVVSYRYDGTIIEKESTTFFSGKRELMWFREEESKSTPAKRVGDRDK